MAMGDGFKKDGGVADTTNSAEEAAHEAARSTLPALEQVLAAAEQ